MGNLEIWTLSWGIVLFYFVFYDREERARAKTKGSPECFPLFCLLFYFICMQNCDKYGKMLMNRARREIKVEYERTWE